ncbi:MAG: tyrosine-type recombinase/integrase [Atopobiaceae bacterium]|nr:tyrosine-type recombinase/integrase [Atopobiaceae bacterium]
MRRGYGHIEALGQGRYRCYWRENGRQRSKVVRGTRRDAELLLAEKALEQTGSLKSGITYSDYWRIGVRPTFGNLAERTVIDYERLWEVELLPRIGGVEVERTTWRFVQSVLAEVNSPTVQHYAYRLWKKVCNLAIRDGLLSANPVDRHIVLLPIKKRDKRMLTPEEVAALLEGAKDYKHIYLVAVEIGAGLRHEEACALTRSDISFEDGRAILSVSKALTVGNGKIIRKDTKTALSRRLVALGEPFLRVLQDNLARVPENVEQQSSPQTITRNWKAYCDRHGLTHIPFGQMRTLFSVLHQQAGSIDSLVSLAMGHSDGTTRGANYLVQTLPAMRMLADNMALLFTEM